MKRTLTTATACILGLTFAAMSPGGDHRHSSSSKRGGDHKQSSSSKKGNDHKESSPMKKGGDHKESTATKTGGGKDDNSGGKNGKKTDGKTVVQKGPNHPIYTPVNPPVPGKNKPPKTIPSLTTAKTVANKPNVSGGAKNAINRVAAGNFLDANGRQELNNLVAGNPANLNEDELKAVQEVLDYDALAKREQRYLKVENATGEKVTLWLHHQSLADKDEWQWLPTKPVDQEKALRFVLQPNSFAYLSDGDGDRIAAGRARVWAESESGYKWTGYRDSDLKLKPSGDPKEVREMGTYALRLRAKDEVQTQAKK